MAKKRKYALTIETPYVKGRVLDLSHGAAKKLGMAKAGKAHVKIVAKRKPKTVHKKKASPNKISSNK